MVKNASKCQVVTSKIYIYIMHWSGTVQNMVFVRKENNSNNIVRHNRNIWQHDIQRKNTGTW